MFGTLVVCLPSKHEGGEVVLSHAGELVKVETAPSSDFDLSALTWYSDVKYEIKPIVSGHRLVITFNLIKAGTSESKPSAKALDKRAARIDKLLKLWRNDEDEEPIYVYSLDHQYTDVSLSTANLKSRDRAVVRCLQDACLTNEFYFFLARMDRVEDTDPYEKNDKPHVYLNNLLAPDGTQLKDSIYIDEAQIIQYDHFDRDPDSDEEDYTGNESMPVARRYHDTVRCKITGLRNQH